MTYTLPPPAAPPWSSAATTATDFTFQQLAPYIGRVKTSIARHLIDNHTQAGDLVVDPFCGSGVIPLEAAAAGRRVIASDLNPYAVLLTRAKLGPPRSADAALTSLHGAWQRATARRGEQDLRQIPQWVRKFFHRETLRDALALRDELAETRSWFLQACLLGILHHQRPGFLSHPSSHLVPYLRTKLFPVDEHPELYGRRAVLPRMEAKVARAYRRPAFFTSSYRVHECDSRRVPLPARIDAVITSPPYMNELDYVRDNRLRLWFIHRGLPATSDIKKRERAEQFRKLMEVTLTRLATRIHKHGRILLVVGDLGSRGKVAESSRIVTDLFATNLRQFRCTEVIKDDIPDIRRSRRDLRGTKRETVLVYERT